MRLDIVALALAAAFLAGPSSGQDNRPLTDVDINRLLAAYEGPTEAPDPFATPGPSTLNGRSIRFERVIGMEGSAGGDPFWTWAYAQGRGVLTISILPEDFNLMNTFQEGPAFVVRPGSPMAGFPTFHSEDPDGVTRMTNSYGATADVEVFRSTEYGFAQISDGFRPVFPGLGDRVTFLTHEVRLPPEEARALAANLRLVVDAEVRDFKPGRAIVCGTSYFEPTIRHPKEVLGRVCVLSAQISRVAIVDGRTGDVVKEWR